MSMSRMRFLAGCATFVVLLGATAGAQVTVYNNFGDDYDGWAYDTSLGWSIAGEDLTFPSQFGIEQAIGCTCAAQL